MKRNAYFDNARLILIFLVVFGHMIQPFIENSSHLNTLYMWIYTFHMPAFIFIAGFFARGYGTIGYISKLAKKLLLPYLIFHLIYTGYYFFIVQEDLNTLFMWIYTFHLSAFIFIAGFFARGYGTIGYIAKLAKKLLLPYLFFQLIYTGYYFFIGKDDWQTGIFEPHWSLWFLFSLFSWHLLLYLFKKHPPLVVLAITVQIYLIVSYL